MSFYIYTEEQAKKFTDSFKFAVCTLKATLDANPNNPKISEANSLTNFLERSWRENLKLEEFIGTDIQEIVFSMVLDRVIRKWKFFASKDYPVPARMSGDTKPYPWTHWQFDVNENSWKEFMDDDEYNEWLESDFAKAHIQDCLKFTTTSEFISEFDIAKITTPLERWSIHTPYGRAHHDAAAFLFEYVMNQDILKLAVECSRIILEIESRDRERKYDGCHCHD